MLNLERPRIVRAWSAAQGRFYWRVIELQRNPWTGELSPASARLNKAAQRWVNIANNKT